MLVAEFQFPLALHINQDKKEIPMCNDNIYSSETPHHENIATLKKSERMAYIKKYYKGARSTDTPSFIERAKWIYGDKYDYTKTIYVGSFVPVTIVCPIHGDFEQKPPIHLRGSACKLCGYESYTNSKESFIAASVEIHGDKYDYSKMEYKNLLTPAKIICKIHGEFEQLPKLHKSGYGCQICSAESIGDSKRFSKEEFIKKATNMHGDRFDYTKTVYKNSVEKFTVTCKLHGDFETHQQLHTENVSGGCRECHRIRMSTSNKRSSLLSEKENKDSIVYHVRLTSPVGEVFDKVGITTKSVKERFNSTEGRGFVYEIIKEYKLPLHDAILVEENFFKMLDSINMRYKIRTLKNYNLSGWTECFESGILAEDTIDECLRSV